MRFDIPQNISLEWSGLSYTDPHMFSGLRPVLFT